MIAIVVTKKHFYIFNLLLVLVVSLSFVYYRAFKNYTVPTYITSDYFYIALIIDDFGNNSDGIELFKSLNVPFTAAVMPNMPYTHEESLFFYNSQNDVILHMPMQPKLGSNYLLGDKPVTVDQSSDEIRENILHSLNQINGAVGINNHMGSKAMEDPRIVNILLEIAKEKDLIVIDSKTTSMSLPKKLAPGHGVTVFERDIFLDSITLEPNKIKENLDKTAKIAKERGYAIAIGHVGASGGAVTAKAINEKAPKLESQNIKFVTITELNHILNSN
jgi:uncharacterized protein